MKVLPDCKRRNGCHWLLYSGPGEAQFFPSPDPLPPGAPSASLCGEENQVNGILAASGWGWGVCVNSPPTPEPIMVSPPSPAQTNTAPPEPLKSPGDGVNISHLPEEAQISLSHQKLPWGFDFSVHFGHSLEASQSAILLSMLAQYGVGGRLWIRKAPDSGLTPCDLRQNPP